MCSDAKIGCGAYATHWASENKTHRTARKRSRPRALDGASSPLFPYEHPAMRALTVVSIGASRGRGTSGPRYGHMECVFVLGAHNRIIWGMGSKAEMVCTRTRGEIVQSRGAGREGAR
jgi:hypothetical protein